MFRAYLDANIIDSLIWGWKFGLYQMRYCGKF